MEPIGDHAFLFHRITQTSFHGKEVAPLGGGEQARSHRAIAPPTCIYLHIRQWLFLPRSFAVAQDDGGRRGV